MEPITFTLDRGRTLTLTPVAPTPLKLLLGQPRELLASAADERGGHAGTVMRNDVGTVLLLWPNGNIAKLTDAERERLEALFAPRRVADLPAWEEMGELDRGAALMHAWKRHREGARYARQHYPARYLGHPRLVALGPELACRHAVTVAGTWDGAVDRLGMDEVERLYDAALAEDDRRRGVVRRSSAPYRAAQAAAGVASHG